MQELLAFFDYAFSLPLDIGMTAWYKHIAVFAIVFFLFPIVYQPIHQVHHYGQDQIEPGCEHHHDHQLHHDHDQAAESAHLYHSPEHCPICEYEFVIQDLPCSAELVLATMQYCEQKTIFLRGEVYKSAYSPQSPRAPPKA